MSKFKVGDKVKIIKQISYEGYDMIGSYHIGKITKITGISTEKENFPYELELPLYGLASDDELELVEEEPRNIWGQTRKEVMEEQIKKYEPYKNPYYEAIKNGDILYWDVQTNSWSKAPINKNNKQTKNNIMSKITTFAKNLVLSADEKLLRKYGLKNECGEFTDEAESLVIAKLVKENEAYLIELAKAMEAEEAKK